MTPPPSSNLPLNLPVPEPYDWPFWRRIILIGLCGGALLTFIKILFFPQSYRLQPLNFPATVPLPPWQQAPAIALAKPTQPEADKLFSFINGQAYQYRQGQKVLTIEMRYFAPSVGDVKGLITYYRNANVPPLTLKQMPGMGYYALLTDKQRSHLTACLTPKGGTVVTREQFFQTRYTSDLRLNRLLSWMVGRTPLLDNRCLWMDLSLPENNISEQGSNYTVLQQVWPTWSQWWQPYFEQHLP